MLRRLLTIVLLLSLLAPAPALAPMRAAASTLSAPQKSSKKKSSSSSKKRSGSSATSKKKSSGSKKKSGSSAAAKKTPQTSADAKRQQQATQNEIKQTKQEIEVNERELQSGLEDLVKIEGDIKANKRTADALTREVNELNRKIGEIDNTIRKDEAELASLRESYLKSIKKLRLNKAGKSQLAFIFSSDSFNEGMRRARYLKRFSEWRERKSNQINQKIKALEYQTKLLEQTRSDKDVVLAKQLATQKELQTQYAEQDRLVGNLKASGAALKAHLAKKQAEARALNDRISQLIAEEQRKAEAQRAAEEKARREAEAKAAAEEKARLEAEEKTRKEAEAAEKAQAAQAAEKKSEPKKTETKKAETKKAETKKTETKKAETKKAETKKAETKKAETKKSDGKDYAAARNRKSRGESASNAQTPAKAGSSFESCKGSLPKPASGGTFKITSPFGRHTLPDLPDVEYDNPGINAEVASGSSAQAVYGGKVSGVYKLPGYGTVVIVSHGSYYTVYGNIEGATVGVGDQVKAGQNLGKLLRDDSGRTSIHFEVWHNRDKLNPSAWIR